MCKRCQRAMFSNTFRFAKKQINTVLCWFANIMSILPWLLPKQWRTHDFRDNPNRIPHSTTSWFTEFCKSLCLSQFTAPFINVWAKASIAEHVDQTHEQLTEIHSTTQQCINMRDATVDVTLPSWFEHLLVKWQASAQTHTNTGSELCTTCKWSFRRFTYGNLVTTSPSSKW